MLARYLGGVRSEFPRWGFGSPTCQKMPAGGGFVEWGNGHPGQVCVDSWCRWRHRSRNCLLNSLPRAVFACTPNLFWRTRASRGYQLGSGGTGEPCSPEKIFAYFAWELRNTRSDLKGVKQRNVGGTKPEEPLVLLPLLFGWFLRLYRWSVETSSN